MFTKPPDSYDEQEHLQVWEGEGGFTPLKDHLPDDFGGGCHGTDDGGSSPKNPSLGDQPSGGLCVADMSLSEGTHGDVQ